MSDEFIAYIILILEIQIESTLCNACLANYIRNGSLAEAFGSEIFKSSFQQRRFLHLFIDIYLTHIYPPWRQNPAFLFCPKGQNEHDIKKCYAQIHYF